MKLSIRKICEKYEVPNDTCKKALQRCSLPGKKALGRWFIEEKDAEKYFEKPKSPDWLPLKLAANLFQIQENLLLESVENGKIKAKKHKNRWYICVKTIKNAQNLVKKRKKKEPLVAISGSFVVKNRRGLHCRPSTEIVRLVKKYNIINSRFKIDSLILENPDVFDLMMHEIQGGSKVHYKVWGAKSSCGLFQKELKFSAKNNFSVAY